MQALKPASVGDLGTAKVSGVATGGGHACAWTDTGKIKCWGDNSLGQLGYGDKVARPKSPSSALDEVDVGAGFAATRMALGYGHTCALSATALRCWGSNAEGELGAGSAEQNIGDQPGEMGGTLADTSVGGAVARASAGQNITCMVANEGKVGCYGPASVLGVSANDGRDKGKLGANAATLDLGGKAKSIASGDAHACALLEDGNVKCWGQNTDGQLGHDGLAQGVATPLSADLAPVGVGAKVLAIAAGGATTCVIVEGGLVKCWGRNTNGQLGIGSRAPDSAAASVDKRAPFLVKGQRAVELAVGGNHVCAYVEGGNLYCWGANDKGQLGIGSAVDVGVEPGEMDRLVAVNL
jgi:alpha-tubulin suppressor-like RCC1 family protein